MAIIAGRTDRGARAGDNQDAIGWNEAGSLAFVADGLGGHSSGQLASQIVKDTLLTASDRLGLQRAVLAAHDAVATAAARDSALTGMASTFVGLQIARSTATIVWVGDSRAYLWRNGVLSRLTRDHSVVEELRLTHGLSEAEMLVHPRRNEVTNVLGAGEPDPESREIPMQIGDCILLCSDGLSGEVTDAELAAILTAAPSPEDAAVGLIAAALARGGHDNVSAVVVKYDGPSKARFFAGLAKNTIMWLAVLVGVVAAAATAGIVLWIRSKR